MDDRNDPIEAEYTVIDVPAPDAPAPCAGAMSTACGRRGDSDVHPRFPDTRNAPCAYAKGSDHRGRDVDLRV